MKIYKTQKEVEKDIKDGVLTIDDDVTFECSISIEANINAGDIKAGDINARNINARNINAWNINAWNINAGDIKAWDIKAGDINAGDINAGDINAWNINAGDINAGDIKAGDIDAKKISYYAFCCVYSSIKCTSIEGRREKHSKPICLDGKLEIINDKVGQEVEVKMGGKTYKAKIISED